MPPMTYDPRRHHRRSIRLPGYDYAAAGAYFVTIVIEGRRCLLGTVDGGTVAPTEIGRAVAACWQALSEKYPHLELDEFVVMPNHLHGIVVSHDPPGVEGAGSPRPLSRPTLGQVVGFFKYQSTVAVNQLRATPGTKLWQRNYYEHIIRNDASRARIREYIATNPERWSADGDNPHGDGTDDVEAWVATLDHGAGGGTPPATSVRRIHPVRQRVGGR